MDDACNTAGSAKTVMGMTQMKSDALVSLTERAAEKLKEFMMKENKEGYGLRIAILPGGCSGYTTSLTFEKTALESDIKLEYFGVPVYVDKMSEQFLHGSTVDYVESLQGAGFTVNNPNAKGSCGCGASATY